MTLSKVIRAQEEVLTSQSGSATTNMAWIGQKYAQPQSPPKYVAHLALSRDPHCRRNVGHTAVTPSKYPRVTGVWPTLYYFALLRTLVTVTCLSPFLVVTRPTFTEKSSSELARLAYRFHIELSSNKARSSDEPPPGKKLFRDDIFEMIKRGHFDVLRKNQVLCQM